MNWSLGLTAEEATLLATGHDHRSSIAMVYKNDIDDLEMYEGSGDYPEMVLGATQDLAELQSIFIGLINEIERLSEGYPSVLEFYLQRDNLKDSLIAIDSLAQWFYKMGDIEKARKVFPNFTPNSQENASSNTELSEKNAQLEAANKKIESLSRMLGAKDQDFDEEQFHSSLKYYEQKQRVSSIDMPSGFAESVDALKAENSDLMKRLEDAEKEIAAYIDEANHMANMINSLKQKDKDYLFDKDGNLMQTPEANKPICLDNITNYPSGIKNAIQVFNECWSHLPDDMKRPAKENLEGFIKTKLRKTEKTTIKALIKLSTPDNDRYHGKPKTGRTQSWKPKSFN